MTAEEFTLREVEPQAGPVPTAVQVSQGMPIPAVARLRLMSADEWEQFTEEWVTHLKHQGEYVFVRRSGGAGDRGLDVVAFTSELGFGAAWDSYQCKHYAGRARAERHMHGSGEDRLPLVQPKSAV